MHFIKLSFQKGYTLPVKGETESLRQRKKGRGREKDGKLERSETK